MRAGVCLAVTLILLLSILSGAACASRIGDTAPTATEAVPAYIGNANTKKLHRLDCPSAAVMNEENRVWLYSRREAIEQGFVPCKRCDP